MGGACGVQTEQLSGGGVSEGESLRVAMWALLFLGPPHAAANEKKMSELWRVQLAATNPCTHTTEHKSHCTRSAFISCHLSKWNLPSIFNIPTTCLLGSQHTPCPCTEQTTVKYHTSLLVFYHRGETFPPLKRANPSDLPHFAIELFLISWLFFIIIIVIWVFLLFWLSDCKREMP